MIYFIIFIIVIFILYYLYDISNVEEEYKDESIIFLSSLELCKLLIKDEDNYYKRFTKNDMKVRNINSIIEYNEKIENSVSDFEEKEKELLNQLIKQIDTKIKNIRLEYFDGNKCCNIKWKFGIIKNELYEEGLPHTRRKDTIIISKNLLKRDEKDLMRTLLHEKVHIYQKQNDEEVDKYLIINGYKKLKKREEKDNIRANIDTDDWIYIDNYKIENKAIYINNAEKITDVIYIPCNSQKCEHPFENMAIEISSMIK